MNQLSEPQQGLRQDLQDLLAPYAETLLDVGIEAATGTMRTARLPKNTNMIDALVSLIEQTLHDCLPEKITAGSIEHGIPANYGFSDNADTQKGFNSAIDQTRANFKRRIES